MGSASQQRLVKGCRLHVSRIAYLRDAIFVESEGYEGLLACSRLLSAVPHGLAAVQNLDGIGRMSPIGSHMDYVSRVMSAFICAGGADL